MPANWTPRRRRARLTIDQRFSRVVGGHTYRNAFVNGAERRQTIGRRASTSSTASPPTNGCTAKRLVFMLLFFRPEIILQNGRKTG